MNPANKFMIFFGLLDLFYDNPLDFGPIINPQFLFPIYGIFWQCAYVIGGCIFFSAAYIGKKQKTLMQSFSSLSYNAGSKFNVFPKLVSTYYLVPF